MTDNTELLEDLRELCAAVQSDIQGDYQAFEEDEEPGIQLTVGTNDKLSDWGYQTGNNSFSGAAYHYPHWAVVGVYRDSDCMELARDIVDQWMDQIAQTS